MGITRGQLKKLGFKSPSKSQDLIYLINKTSWLYLGKGKTVIFYISNLAYDDFPLNITNLVNSTTGYPLVHLQYTTYGEMFNFLRGIKHGENIMLKEQIENI